MKHHLVSLSLLFSSALPSLAQEEPIKPFEIRANMPGVTLDKLIYVPGDSLTAKVTFIHSADVQDTFLSLIFVADSSGDMEVIPLDPTGDPLVYELATPLAVVERKDPVTMANGSLELAPGELFTALLSYKVSDRVDEQAGTNAFSSDWGMLRDPNPKAGTVTIVPNASLTPDERRPPPGLPPLGTLFVQGEPGPVQIVTNELTFLPAYDGQVQELIDRTGATILGVLGSTETNPGIDDLPQGDKRTWLRLGITGDPAKIAQLPQLRTMVGEQRTLSASNEETLALIATAMELWCEGYAVGLQPRLQLHGPLTSPEGLYEETRIDAYGNAGSRRNGQGVRIPTDDNPRNISEDNIFGVRKCWALLSMFDRDVSNIPVGVIDTGFASNPDFKTGHPLYGERNLQNGTSGIGSAQVPQAVGNSGVGGKIWHGNGTVTTISGVLGNRFGHAGVGAQTAVPKLYHMGLSNIAFGFGTAIQLAVDDGCVLINISAGYPCRILSVLGHDDICSPDSRAAFVLKLGIAVRAAAAAACAASGILDAVIPGLGAVVCATSLVSAEVAALSMFGTVFLGETRGPVETAVAYATSRGVTIVASAGNDLAGSIEEPLASLVALENTNIDDWQIIPAVIPDVIAVGTSDRTGSNHWDGNGFTHHANRNFWGAGVDLWAPDGSWYWAPEPAEADPSTIPASAHIRRVFGATSNSAPYVTGVIANMMSLDPTLDPRNVSSDQLSAIPSRICAHLVNHAHQLGDPACPDSVDDVATFALDPETEEWEELEPDEVPAELLAQMARRRNMVHPWAAVREAARNGGLLEYEAHNYQPDLGDDDSGADHALDVAAREPAIRNFPALLVNEEITPRDTDFWFLRAPTTAGLHTFHIEATIPDTEERSSLLLNGLPGTPSGPIDGEYTLRWESRPIWNRRSHGIEFSGTQGADIPYKFDVTTSSAPPPPADRYDRSPTGNNQIWNAAGINSWLSAPPRGLLEVQAWEICIEDLNFHRTDDVDFFRIEFPSYLNVPTSCGAVDPWVTIQLDPPNPSLRIEVYSRRGEMMHGTIVWTDTRLERADGAETLRLDCRDYLRNLPLYVKVDNPGGVVSDYALKLRWSVPDPSVDDRLDPIIEAWSGPREIPEYEQFFQPEIPWLRLSPGLLSPELTNPNPNHPQALGPLGEYLASRLFLVEVPPGASSISFMAFTGIAQSLRMEFVHLNEEVDGAAGTPSLGFPFDSKNVFGERYRVLLPLNDVFPGTYILRLSGHSPGDEISLYLSENLVPPGTLSIESFTGLDPTPTLLPPLDGFDELDGSALLSNSTAFPSLPRGEFFVRRARDVIFDVKGPGGFRTEFRDTDGIWKPYGPPQLITEAPALHSVLVPFDASHPVRLVELGGGGALSPQSEAFALHLAFQTVPGAVHQLMGSGDLEQFVRLNSSFTGDGTLTEWFSSLGTLPPGYYFRVESQ